MDGPDQSEGAQAYKEEKHHDKPDTRIVKGNSPEGNSQHDPERQGKQNEEAPPGDPVHEWIDLGKNAGLDPGFFLLEKLVSSHDHDRKNDEHEVDLEKTSHGISLLVEDERLELLRHDHVDNHGIWGCLSL